MVELATYVNYTNKIMASRKSQPKLISISLVASGACLYESVITTQVPLLGR